MQMDGQEQVVLLAREDFSVMLAVQIWHESDKVYRSSVADTVC